MSILGVCLFINLHQILFFLYFASGFLPSIDAVLFFALFLFHVSLLFLLSLFLRSLLIFKAFAFFIQPILFRVQASQFIHGSY